MADQPVVVNGYRAPSAPARATTVVVQHGVLRNGHDYRDFWVEAADRFGLLILAPTFPEAHWPDVDAYNNGNLFCEGHTGGTRNLQASAYACVQRLARLVKGHDAVDPARLYLFGHSAGSQFVHRYAAVCGLHDYAGVIAANAGWYTLPEPELPFPKGWQGTGLAQDACAAMFSYPLVLFVGSNDNDPNAQHLPNEPAAMLQGATRYERAHYFFNYAREQASRWNAPFNWSLHTIPHVAHDGRLMSHVAAQHWFGAGIPDADTLRALTAQAPSFTA
jgi:poly(3-hydroxybutyrate) depolymerase